MTKNLIVQTDKSAQDFQEQMNTINSELGKKVFATQTHLTVVNDVLVYTAVFFVHEDK